MEQRTRRKEAEVGFFNSPIRSLMSVFAKKSIADLKDETGWKMLHACVRGRQRGCAWVRACVWEGVGNEWGELEIMLFYKSHVSAIPREGHWAFNKSGKGGERLLFQKTLMERQWQILWSSLKEVSWRPREKEAQRRKLKGYDFLVLLLCLWLPLPLEEYPQDTKMPSWSLHAQVRFSWCFSPV